MKKFIAMACCLGLFFATGCGADTQRMPELRPAPRVACVGDSITQGYGGHSYVALLDESKPWVMGNFGVCGTTALFQNAQAYRDTDLYKESLRWKPDVVVLMLGTNDTAYWQGKETFADNYEALVDTYLTVTPHVLLCTPLAPDPDVIDNGHGIESTNYGVICDVIHAIADKKGLPVSDVYARTHSDAVTLADGVHPNAHGAQLIADTVALSLEEEHWV